MMMMMMMRHNCLSASLPNQQKLLEANNNALANAKANEALMKHI